MHSTSRGPPVSERCSGLPCMPCPLRELVMVDRRVPALRTVEILRSTSPDTVLGCKTQEPFPDEEPDE